MKQIKRIMAMFLVAMMTMGLFVTTTFADDETPGGGTSDTTEGSDPATKTYTVTITGNSEDKGTHTYGAYQIFTGNLDPDTGTIGNIQWGSGISEEGKTKLGDASAYAKTLTDANAAEKAAELSKYLTTAEKTGADTIEGLTGGYYLIKDEANSPTGDKPNAQTKFILKVLKDETVAVKSSVPSVEKKVQDINDSDATPSLSNLQDSADYDIGDSIPYTVTATIGTGISNFDSYSFQFVDEMSKGLTLDNTSWDIKVGDKSIKTLFNLTSAAGENGATVWTWAATDIKAEIADGSKVVLTYNCTLNKDAVVGSAGNPNTVKLKFDNNPNDSGKGTPGGETPEDKNIVFTYKTVFNKTDKDKKPLTGADFKLEKKVNGTWVDVTTLGSGDNKPTKTGDKTGSTFEFSGLDDGEYKLTEIETPKGYNTIDPIEFTITAEHEVLSDNPALTALTGTDGKEFTMTPNVPAGSLTADVVNQKGTELPSTGGIGTTMFYIIGSAMVLGAGIILTSKMRANN